MKGGWIHSPCWDGCWFLSGVPIGLAFMLIERVAHVSYATIAIYTLIAVQMAHSLSPIVLAWSHSEFRWSMYANPLKFVVLPLAILGATTLAGAISIQYFPEYQFLDDTSSRLMFEALYRSGVWQSPAEWAIVLYLIWNFYHFGKQNFGVMSIYKKASGENYGPEQRLIDKTFCMMVQTCVALTLFLPLINVQNAVWVRLAMLTLFVGSVFMLLREAAITGRFFSPRIVFALGHALSLLLGSGVWTLAINGVNHWLTAIGLAAHVHGRRTDKSPLIFAGLMILVGFVFFWALFWKVGVYSWNPREMMHMLLPVLTLRLGIGMVHFLYDRWVWKISDPNVRATIGQSLFPRPALVEVPMLAKAA